MNNNSLTPVPTWFWVVSGIALLWNALGVMAYVADVSQTPADLAEQGQLVVELYSARPAWAVAAFAIAVFAGLLGCLALLLRRTLATPLLLISLVALIVQNVYWFGLAKAHQHFPAGSHIMPALVFLVALGLLVFARSSAAKGWLK